MGFLGVSHSPKIPPDEYGNKILGVNVPDVIILLQKPMLCSICGGKAEVEIHPDDPVLREPVACPDPECQHEPTRLSEWCEKQAVYCDTMASDYRKDAERWRSMRFEKHTDHRDGVARWRIVSPDLEGDAT